MTRRARWSLGILGGCGLVLLAGCGWLAVDRWKAKHAWLEYRQAALARGEKMAFRDYLPAAVAPEENFATLSIFSRGKESDGRLKLAAAGKQDGKPDMPSHLAAAKAAMIDAGWLKKESAPEHAGEAVLQGFTRFKTELDELRAARSRSKASFLDPAEAPPNTSFAFLSGVMNANAWCALRLEAHLTLQQRDEALEDLRDQVRIYQALRGEPTMISGLTRLAVLSVARAAVDSGLKERSWRPEDLAEIQKILGSIDLAADAEQAFTLERGFMNDAADTIDAMPIAIRMRRAEEFESLGEKKKRWRLWLEVFNGQPFRERMNQNLVLNGRLRQARKGWQFFSKEAVPSTGSDLRLVAVTYGLMKRYLSLEVSIRQTRIVCALECFRAAHADYPASLDALVPQCLSEVPLDAVDGRPFKYRRISGDRFLLYSVGLNGLDDGGSAEENRGRGNYKVMDWVWGES